MVCVDVIECFLLYWYGFLLGVDEDDWEIGFVYFFYLVLCVLVLFDVVVNSVDCKGGYVLVGFDFDFGGIVYVWVVDNGLIFYIDFKF